ncbi:DUF5682 family protein [Kitasatospora sp. NPDC004240]
MTVPLPTARTPRGAGSPREAGSPYEGRPLPGNVRFLGVRHHSPACARLVAETIERTRPAFVLVEGPVDMNDRLEELLLGHRLPVAVFSHYRDEERAATSWTPLCDYSPEWVALTAGRAAGAQVRFIDLPAWHPAFAERANRYADAEARYAEVTARLCARFAVDSVDALWDRLFEGPAAEGPIAAGEGPTVAEDGPTTGDPTTGSGPATGGGPATEGPAPLAERLDAYFELLRGDAEADPGDRARERYMADWVRATVAEAAGRGVLVVTGGFHRPALRALLAADLADGPAGAAHGDADGGPALPAVPGLPAVPAPPEGSVGGSFLVPYSFRQLDSFAGYQSGMPSPGYHQEVWEHGGPAAAEGLFRAVARRLRERRHPVSTADLIAARSMAEGLAALRGHPRPSRLDVLDGLAGALISEDLDRPLPWTGRGTLAPGSHPVVVELVAVCSGERTGRLHPDTPMPPLVLDVRAQLAAHRLDAPAGQAVTLRLTDPDDLTRSRLLHRLRVLGVPGFERTAGPAHGTDPVFAERWEAVPAAGREAALIEAGGYGATLEEAATVALALRARGLRGAADHGPEAVRTPGPALGAPAVKDAGALAGLLFDAVVCGADGLSERLITALAEGVRELREPGPLGTVLATALGLWRHDRVYGAARGPLLGAVVDRAVERLLWLLEGLHGSGGADLERLGALAAVRDALRHAEPLLSVPRGAALEVCRRIAADEQAPPDLRGGAVGLRRALGEPVDHAAVRAAARPEVLGDWLAGLFALAREEVLDPAGAPPGGGSSLIDLLDGLVGEMTDAGFLTALPALRQAFAFFPPRERERIARLLIERRGLRGSARALLRTTTDPLLIARAKHLEDDVERLLSRYGLGGGR